MLYRRSIWVLVWLFILWAFCLVQFPAHGEPEIGSEDAQLLRESNISVDPASLLAYFRARIALLKDRDKLLTTVRKLGADDFTVREQATRDLIAVGQPAIALLREHLKDSDKEVSRRARYCLKEIPHSTGPALSEAAIRLLVKHRGSECVKVLLDYFPCAEDEGVEDEILQALESITRQDSEAAEVLQSGKLDPNPLRRAAVAHVLVLATKPGSPLAQSLLSFLTDRHPSVRFFAARALLRRGHAAALPALITVLDEGNLTRAWEAEGLLRQVAGGHAPSVAMQGSLKSRTRCREAWSAWLRDKQGKVTVPYIDRPPHRRQQAVFADLDGERVWATAFNGKTLWQIKDLQGPVHAQVLPSGRVLVTENHAERVTERDLSGKIYWTESTNEPPLSAWRLPNGHTMIAMQHSLVDISPEGETAFTIHLDDEIYSARPLRGDRMAVLTAAPAIRVMSTRGDPILCLPLPPGRPRGLGFSVLPRWSGFSVLPNGHYLIPVIPEVRFKEGVATSVVELDCQGRKLWDCENICTICAACLPNGTILVCNPLARMIHEVDRKGKILRSRRTDGRPWFVQVLP